MGYNTFIVSNMYFSFFLFDCRYVQLKRIEFLDDQNEMERMQNVY